MKKIIRNMWYVLIAIVSNVFAVHEVHEVKDAQNKKVIHAHEDVARQAQQPENSGETVRTVRSKPSRSVESKDTAHITDAQVFFESEDTDIE